MKAIFRKTQTGLVPANNEGQDFYAKVKDGGLVTAEFKKKQNPKFHAKMFALLMLGFNNWKQPEVEVSIGGEKVLPEKDFDRFRKDITILAGFYHSVFRIDGTFRIEADSLSFDRMSPEKREQAYSKFIDVLLANVYGADLTHGDMDKMVNTYLAFT